MNNAQLINQTSGAVEWYTPAPIVEAARRVMGGIDLDPASTLDVNKRIGAALVYTKEDDGLSLPWLGRVWMNHPFGDSEQECKPNCKKKRCDPAYAALSESKRPSKWRGHCIDYYVPGNEDWINKLIGEYERGRVRQACCITFASTSEAWFQPLFDYPLCFLTGRTNYLLPDGGKATGATKGSVVAGIGVDLVAFVREFSKLGRVMRPCRL